MIAAPDPARPHWSHARSWQLVAATSTDRLDHARSGPADVTIADLEDGVADAAKDHARDLTHTYLHFHSIWVRISAVDTPGWSRDLDMLATAPGVLGVVLAKAESADQVTDTAHRLPHTPIVALIESALGIEEVRSIAEAPATVRLAFGSGDYRRDTATADTPIALAYPRSRLVIASRVAGIAAPIDGPTVTTDPAVLSAGITASIDTGMTGKLCLTDTHAATINTAFTPSVDDRAWADQVISDLGEHGERVTLGSDRPRLARALRIRTRAAAFTPT